MRSQSQSPFTALFRKQYFWPFSVLCLLVVVGTAGYCLLEGWTFVESFYMTVMTLSTVGFMEVRPLSEIGRLFTVFLIISGVGVVAFTFAAFSRDIVEGEFRKIRRFRRMEKSIARLKNHVIVCGYGRLARLVTKDLLELNRDLVVIDHDHNIIEELAQDERFLFVEGAAHDDESLKRAGIERASTLLALVANEAENVYITLSSRDLNPKMQIVARAESEAAEHRLRRAGANKVLSPYRAGATRLVQQLLRPNVSDFLEIASSPGGKQLLLEEVVVPADSIFHGKSLEESELRAKTGAIIAAFIDAKGELSLSPSRQSIIQAGTTMIVLGDKMAVDRVSELVAQHRPA